MSNEFPVAKFKIGDRVQFLVVAEVKGFKLSKWITFWVVGLGLSSDESKRLIVYDLSTDPTAAYHGGKIDFQRISEGDLVPEQEAQS
jgi:hypothetical protein